MINLSVFVHDFPRGVGSFDQLILDLALMIFIPVCQLSMVLLSSVPIGLKGFFQEFFITLKAFLHCR